MTRQYFKDIFDVRLPTILRDLFTQEALNYAISRVSSVRDKEDLVAHPLRRPILIEYRAALSSMLSRLVPAGRWSPTTAYLVLTTKRSGTYRELVFPSLVDSIVGRRAIDALEPIITADDAGKTFCGRSHANTTREPGDYENWFAVWQDFTAAVGVAAQGEGFAYVFETDVAEFFPTIGRDRARQLVAQRTQAHASLIELIFYCLESWLPRFGYSPQSGIPIENNDVSRLIAHNYLKAVDSVFVSDPSCRYLRFVDDTVVFVRSTVAAEQVRERHHYALRENGLSPSPGKTSILSVADYEATRHREMNLKLDAAKVAKDTAALAELATVWYEKDSSETPAWDQVAKRLYKVARDLGSPCMRARVVSDLHVTPVLTQHALDYLVRYVVTADELERLLEYYQRSTTSIEQRIRIARFLCDARLEAELEQRMASFCENCARKRDVRAGDGYARGLLILVLNKYGDRAARGRVSSWATSGELDDPQLRLHLLYTFGCSNELADGLLADVRHLATSDIELTMRLCDDASRGVLKEKRRILLLMVTRCPGGYTIPARYLPLLRAILGPDHERIENQQWLSRILADIRRPIVDPPVRRFLERELSRLTA